MVKNHLKSIASPKTWLIERKHQVFLTRQKPGAHPLQESMPLTLFLREIAKEAKTAKEVKALLHEKKVLVDGKVRNEPRFPVGLFDVVSFPLIKRNVRIRYDAKGRITANDIDQKEADKKLVRIKNKTCIAKGKIQLNTRDGRNLIVDKDEYKVGDSLLLSLPDQKILKRIPFEKGALVYLIGGKHKNTLGELIDVQGRTITIKPEGDEFTTQKSYAFVVGKGKPEIQL